MKQFMVLLAFTLTHIMANVLFGGRWVGIMWVSGVSVSALLVFLVYAYLVDDFSVYIPPLSILLCLIISLFVLLPLLRTQGGNLLMMAIDVQNSSWMTMILFFLPSLIASFFMNKRKGKRQAEGLAFYDKKSTQHIIAGAGILAGAVVSIVIPILLLIVFFIGFSGW